MYMHMYQCACLHSSVTNASLPDIVAFFDVPKLSCP